MQDTHDGSRGPAMPGLVIVVVQRGTYIRRSKRKKTSPAPLPLLDADWIMLKRGDAAGALAAQFAVKVSLAGIERDHRRGDRRTFMRSVEPGAGQQPD